MRHDNSILGGLRDGGSIGRRSFTREAPDSCGNIPGEDLELVARYCWETSLNLEAVRFMLDCGFPVDYPERSHGYSPLHNAAWAGAFELVELLLKRGHPPGIRDPQHQGTPLNWAIHCCVHERRHPNGAYGRVAAALIDAGCPWDRSLLPTGCTQIDAELSRRVPRAE
jgi:hypothetical protein